MNDIARMTGKHNKADKIKSVHVTQRVRALLLVVRRFPLLVAKTEVKLQQAGYYIYKMFTPDLHSVEIRPGTDLSHSINVQI